MFKKRGANTFYGLIKKRFRVGNKVKCFTFLPTLQGCKAKACPYELARYKGNSKAQTYEPTKLITAKQDVRTSGQTQKEQMLAKRANAGKKSGCFW